MFRFKLRELLARREREQGRRIPLREIAEATGMSVQALSNLNSPHRAVVTNSAHLEVICRYLECTLDEIVEFHPPIGQEASQHLDHLYPGRRRGRET